MYLQLEPIPRDDGQTLLRDNIPVSEYLDIVADIAFKIDKKNQKTVLVCDTNNTFMLKLTIDIQNEKYVIVPEIFGEFECLSAIITTITQLTSSIFRDFFTDREEENLVTALREARVRKNCGRISAQQNSELRVDLAEVKPEKFGFGKRVVSGLKGAWIGLKTAAREFFFTGSDLMPGVRNPLVLILASCLGVLFSLMIMPLTCLYGFFRGLSRGLLHPNRLRRLEEDMRANSEKLFRESSMAIVASLTAELRHAVTAESLKDEGEIDFVNAALRRETNPDLNAALQRYSDAVAACPFRGFAGRYTGVDKMFVDLLDDDARERNAWVGPEAVEAPQEQQLQPAGV